MTSNERLAELAAELRKSDEIRGRLTARIADLEEESRRQEKLIDALVSADTSSSFCS